MESSSLKLDMEQPVKKKRVDKYKILSAVLLVALVVMSLGLGLGLGLRENKTTEPALVTCRNRCYETHSGRDSDCRCDSECTKQGNCCFDYDDLCMKPKEVWTCSKMRCGERRITGSHCSCSEDCLTKGDCCTNYKTVCRGDTPWALDLCENSTNAKCPEGFDIPPLILFSLDGFRAEYLQTWDYLMPNIRQLRDCGTHSKYMRAAYPTKTFPNHYTIVTGLYPESNGIIDNNMYDIHMNKFFSLSGSEKFNESWWNGQPIWLTAMYQGLKAGTFFWPGSDVPINGTFPNLYKLYNNSIVYEERVSDILRWLDLPKNERPDFYTLYLEEPDSSGHSYGPVSGGVIDALMLADRVMGMLLDGLKQRNLHNCVNLIVLADHGMEKTYCEQLEYMTNYFDNINFFYLYDGPAARMRARNVPDDYFTFDSEGIVRNLTCRKPDQHFKPYLTSELPKRFHYANNIRIDKVHLYVDRQWLVVRDNTYTFCGGGNHGYDNEFKSMEIIILTFVLGICFLMALFMTYKKYTQILDIQGTELTREALCTCSGSNFHCVTVTNGCHHQSEQYTGQTMQSQRQLPSKMSALLSLDACQRSVGHLPSNVEYGPVTRLRTARDNPLTVSVLKTLPTLRDFSGFSLMLIEDCPSLQAIWTPNFCYEAIFLGHGPGFKRGVEVEPFENIEVYNLMCDLLQVQPAPNNGTHGSLNHLLSKPFYTPKLPEEKSEPLPLQFSQPTSNLGCFCNLSTNEGVINDRLNLSMDHINQTMNTHLPFGRPKNIQEHSNHSLLYHHGYVSGYSHDILMPLWSAYTIEKGESSSLPPTLPDCLRPDIRIPEAKSQKCSDYKPELNITHSFLHPPNFNKSEIEQYDSLITSNIVPMYKEFQKIWDYLHTTLLLKYAGERNGLNVISGPIFDYNYDGHVDSLNEIKEHIQGTQIPIPTHYYVVLTSCIDVASTPLSCSVNLDALSFIIPHRPDNSESCADGKPASEWVEERLRAHAARVRDVELLTGLDFYQGRNQPVPQILQLKTFLPTFETIVN